MKLNDRKFLAQYGFTTWEEYYKYIDESYINGKWEQAKKLFKMLHKHQHKELLCILLNDLKSDACVIRSITTDNDVIRIIEFIEFLVNEI